MGNTYLQPSPSHSKFSSDTSLFDYQSYVRDGVTIQDVMHMKQAFDNLRDENDRPHEVKLSKLKQFPFFNKQDIARLPRESDRAQNQMRLEEGQHFDAFSAKNIANLSPDDSNNHCDSSQQLRIYQQQNSGIQQRGYLKMESKGIDCHSIMCSCSNGRPYNNIMSNQTVVTFDQFYEIMSEKIKDSRPHSNIIFESKVSNVSCFLWPLFGTQ